MREEWYSSWFNTPYYHTLYKHRDDSEASLFIDKITQFLNLNQHAKCWDLCCGKGRHSVYLNKKGYQVVGTDLSLQSILEANKQANDTLQFYQQDMRRLFRTNYFDAVFNLFTSFGYFERREDDVSVFDAVEKSLKPNGVFIFDFLNSNYIINHIVKEDTKIINGITFHISKKLQGNTIVKTILFSDRGQKFSYEERVKLYDKSYFENLAHDCRFSILNTFGNYYLEEFDMNLSPRLILVLQKK